MITKDDITDFSHGVLRVMESEDLNLIGPRDMTSNFLFHGATANNYLKMPVEAKYVRQMLMGKLIEESEPFPPGQSSRNVVYSLTSVGRALAKQEPRTDARFFK